MHRVVRTARRCVRVLGSILLLVTTLAGLAYVVPGLMGYQHYVITGGSMSGTIERGSVVFEKPVPVKDLVVGDVITYLPPPASGVSTLVTHRIIKKAPGKDGSTVFGTQGDANPDPDPWTFSLTSGDQPVVAQAVPYVGYGFIALSDPQMRMLVSGVPAAVIALIALRDLVAALRPVKGQQSPGRRAGTPAHP